MSSTRQSDTPFLKCEECGSIYLRSTGHHCELAPSQLTDAGDDARHRIDAIRDTDQYDPGRSVLVADNKQGSKPYHREHENDSACNSTAAEWSGVTMAEAHDNAWYPCGHCWPKFVGETK